MWLILSLKAFFEKDLDALPAMRPAAALHPQPKSENTHWCARGLCKSISMALCCSMAIKRRGWTLNESIGHFCFVLGCKDISHHNSNKVAAWAIAICLPNGFHLPTFNVYKTECSLCRRRIILKAAD